MNNTFQFYLKVINRHNPQYILTDYKTNCQMEIALGSNINVALGFFEVGGEPSDLGCFETLGFSILKSVCRGDWEEVYQNSVPASEIRRIISNADWEQGHGNAVVRIRPTQIQTIDKRAKYKIVIRGRLKSGGCIDFGWAPCELCTTALNNLVEMDSAIIPLRIPEGAIWSVQSNQQAIYAIPIVVQGELRVAGALIEIDSNEHTNITTP